MRGLPHKRQNLGRWTDITAFSSSLCSCSVSVETFFSIQMTVRTYLVYTMIPFWKLEASNWDDSAEQNKSELGSLNWSVLLRANMLTPSSVYECATRNFQRAPFTIWHFQSMFQPSKGQLFKVLVGFYPNLVEIGKADRGKKDEWKGQEGQTPAKKKPGKKDFSLLI